MSAFLNRLLGREPRSASLAKDRLKLVIVHDRTDLSPGVLADLKDDLIVTFSRHVEIDPNAVKFQMSHDGREQRLIADIPLRPVRHRR